MNEQTIEDLTMLSLEIGFVSVAIINQNHIVTQICLAAMAVSFGGWVYRRGVIAHRNIQTTLTPVPMPPQQITRQSFQYKESQYTRFDHTATYIVSNALREKFSIYGYDVVFTIELSNIILYGYFTECGAKYLRLSTRAALNPWNEAQDNEYFGLASDLDQIVNWIAWNIYFE